MPKPTNKSRNNLIVRWHDKGMTFRAIADKLEICPSAVHDAYWKHKVMFG